MLPAGLDVVVGVEVDVDVVVELVDGVLVSSAMSHSSFTLLRRFRR